MQKIIYRLRGTGFSGFIEKTEIVNDSVGGIVKQAKIDKRSIEVPGVGLLNHTDILQVLDASETEERRAKNVGGKAVITIERRGNRYEGVRAAKIKRYPDGKVEIVDKWTESEPITLEELEISIIAEYERLKDRSKITGMPDPRTRKYAEIIAMEIKDRDKLIELLEKKI